MPGNLIGSIKHFLDLDRFDSVILRELIENAKKIKSTPMYENIVLKYWNV